MHRYLYLFFSFLSLSAFSQSIKINSTSTSCAGAETTVVFSTTGTFATDNQFSIQISSYYTSTIKVYLATLKNGNLTFTVGANDLPDDLLRNPFLARILTSKPAMQSEAYSLKINKPAKLTLIGTLTPTINPGEPADLQFFYEGSSPLQVVLTDSTRFNLTASYYTVSGSTSQAVFPRVTTNYKIARVSNDCGVGGSSGSATVQVNPISLRTASVGTPRICTGSELRVAYSILGNLATGNRFKLRLTAAMGGSTNVVEDPSKVYDLDAVLDNGFLKATIPGTVPVQAGTIPLYYSVRVITTAPAAVGDHSGYMVSLFPAPAAEFVSGSQTINVGDTYDIGLRIKGIPPYVAELSDGTIARSDYGGETRNTIKPRQTTTYTIRSLQTGCGNVPAQTSGSVIATVRPGLAIDSITTGFVCEGQTMRIRIAHNLTLGAGNAFAVRIQHNTQWTSELIRAQVQGDYLTFTVPAIRLSDPLANRSQGFSLMVSSSQPILGSAWTGNFGIQTYPTLSWSSYNQTTIDLPRQQVSWAWTGAGGGPYQLEMETGETSTATTIAYLSLPAIESRTFRVKTLKNACFSSQNPTPATLTVKGNAERFIFVQPFRNPVCRGDSMELTIRTIGTFQPDNQFRIQVRGGSSCCDFPSTWLQGATGNVLRFRIPANQGWYSTGGTEVVFRIASTNPVVFSDEIRLSIHQPPYGIQFSEAGQDVLLLKPATISKEISYYGGTPIVVNYTVGGKSYSTTTGNDQWYRQIIDYPITQDATFTLNSLANACGPVTDNQSINYRIVPYTLQFTAPNDYGVTPPYCVGSSLSLPYQLVGQVDPNVTFSIQGKPTTSGTFQTWQTQLKGNPLVVTIPDTLTGDYYSVRLVSNKNVVSNQQSFRVGRPTTAFLSTSNNTSAVDLSPTSQTDLQVKLTGSPDWTVLFSDGGRRVYSNSPATYPINASTKTTYRIQSVANACGYGTAAGEVVASIKPTLSLTPVNDTYGVYCKTGNTASVQVSYLAKGDFEPGNRLFIGLIDEYNSTSVRWLDSTSASQGTFKLSLPQSTSLGVHYLRLMSTNPQLTTSMQIALTAPPSVTLGGNAVVNPGQATAIRLLTPPTPGTSQPILYTLSTGETGNVYPGTSAIVNQNVTVQPTQTTTYRVASVSNLCGTGQATGTATVTVNPAADRQVSTGIVQSRSNLSTLCAGDTALVSFSTQGVFSSSNRFTVQLSDSTGTRFTDLPTFGATTTLKALVPAALPRSSFYRVRVVASDNGSISSTNLIPLSVLYSATASFADAVLPLEVGKSTPIKINLTGDAPWSVRIGNEFNPVSQFAVYSSPYTLNVSPVAALTTYRLYQVSNACGTGQLVTPATVQVMVVTAVEISPDHSFVLAPNPTSGQLRISQGQGNKPYKLYLTDANGRVIGQQSVVSAQHELDLSSLPAGVYIIQLRQGDQQSTHRILKQ